MLSMNVTIPRFFPIFATSLMSINFKRGLVGDSKKMTFVLGLIDSANFPASVVSMRSTVTPYLGNTLVKKLKVPP